MSLFGAYLTSKGTQYSTIRSYVSAIKHILKVDKYEWDDNKVLLSAITRACKIKNDVLRTRLPIHIGLLEMLLFEVNWEFQDQPYLRCLYLAMFAIAYYGMFRIGELAMGIHSIRVKDVHISSNKNKMLIVLYTSKRHGEESPPQKIKLTEIDKGIKTIRHFCPFKLMHNFIRFCGGY